MFQGIFTLFISVFLQVSFAAPSYAPSEKSILFQNQNSETIGYFNPHENTLYIWSEIPRFTPQTRPPSWPKPTNISAAGPYYGFQPVMGPHAKYNFLPGETFKKGLINKSGSLMILTEYFNPRLNRMQSLYILPQHPQFRGQRYLFSARPQIQRGRCEQLFPGKLIPPLPSR